MTSAFGLLPLTSQAGNLGFSGLKAALPSGIFNALGMAIGVWTSLNHSSLLATPVVDIRSSWGRIPAEEVVAEAAKLPSGHSCLRGHGMAGGFGNEYLVRASDMIIF